MRDYLTRLKSPQRREVESLLAGFDKLEGSAKKGITRYRLPFESVSQIRASHLDFSSDTVTIGRADELKDHDREKVYQVMRNFMPWRKGPFNIFGIDIWTSNKLPQLTAAEALDASGYGLANDSGSKGGSGH